MTQITSINKRTNELCQSLTPRLFNAVLGVFPEALEDLTADASIHQKKDEFYSWVTAANVGLQDEFISFLQTKKTHQESVRKKYMGYLALVSIMSCVLPILAMANVQTDMLNDLKSVLVQPLKIAPYVLVGVSVFWAGWTFLVFLEELETAESSVGGHTVSIRGVLFLLWKYLYFVQMVFLFSLANCLGHVPVPLNPPDLPEPFQFLLYMQGSIMLMLSISMLSWLVFSKFTHRVPHWDARDGYFICVFGVFFSGVLSFATLPTEVFVNLFEQKNIGAAPAYLSFSWFGSYGGFLVVSRLGIFPILAALVVKYMTRKNSARV